MCLCRASGSLLLPKGWPPSATSHSSPKSCCLLPAFPSTQEKLWLSQPARRASPRAGDVSSPKRAWQSQVALRTFDKSLMAGSIFTSTSPWKKTRHENRKEKQTYIQNTFWQWFQTCHHYSIFRKHFW